MFSDLQNVLFPLLWREPGVSWKKTHFPWHELASLLDCACLYFTASQGKRQEDGMGEVHALQEASSRKGDIDYCGPISRLLCHQNNQSTTAPLWNPRLAFTPNTKHVPNCMCCLGLLLFLTLMGMHHLLLDWENRVRTVCCGNCCKLESVPLGC